MKTMKKIYHIALASMLGLATVSCTDGNDWSVDESFSRLFGLNSDKISVESEDVQATVTFNTVPDAEYYLIEVSTDSLYDEVAMGGANAIVFGQDGSFTTSPAILTGLTGDTRYYLRIKAMSSQKNESKWSYYKAGDSFKTLAEQIFLDPVASDRAESSLHVAWAPNAEVTNLVVSDASGKEVQNITLDAAAKAAGEYTITGLTPSTNYTIVIMNGESKRGTLTMATSAAMPAGDYKVELTGDIERISDVVLNDLLAKAQAATGKETPSITIGLRPDRTYTIASTGEDGNDSSLALPEGVSVTFFGLSGGEAPVMNFTKSLDLAGTHAYIRFENVTFADAGCQYLVNQSNEATVGELSFKQCTISNFERSFIRTQGSKTITIDNILVDNCLCTNMAAGNGYSVFLFGANNNFISKLEITNSTFDTSQRSFIEASKQPVTNGIYITNCTFYNNVASGRYFMDANKMKTNLVMTNTILGKSMDGAKGARTAGSITFDNCLRASDCVYSGNDLKDLGADDRSSADIFKDPDNHDFTLKINQRIGDPRWFPAE